MGTVIVVLFGGFLALDNKITVGDIVGFMLYLNLFYQPISNLQGSRKIPAIQAGADRVFEVLDTEPDVKDSPDAVDITGCRGEIEFDNVSFRYTDDVSVLQDISFWASQAKWWRWSGPRGWAKPIISLIAFLWSGYGQHPA